MKVVKHLLSLPLATTLLFLLLLLLVDFNITSITLLETPREPQTRPPSIVNKHGDLTSAEQRLAEAEDEDESAHNVILTFGEDGRLGNLLMETGTLYLMGKQLNLTTRLLSSVNLKLGKLFNPVPVPVMDPRIECDCKKCRTCSCHNCTNWTFVSSAALLQHPHKFIPGYSISGSDKSSSSNPSTTYIRAANYNTPLVLKHLNQLVTIYRRHLNKNLIDQAQDYLHSLNYTQQIPEVKYVGIHVRRTDYISWIENRYQGDIMGPDFFRHCINYFRRKFPGEVVFVLTSDDTTWCHHNFQGQENLVIPGITLPRSPQYDFVLLSQMNHSIYDYGSYGFWSAALAGGETLIADNYSKRLHPILDALHKNLPPSWTLVDVMNLNKTL